LHLALDSGVKPREISEIVTHLAFYAGWENAMAAVVSVNEVFLARNVAGQYVAIKALMDDASSPHVLAERRTALALTRLRHPCIVSVLHVLTVRNSVFIVMEYVDGTTLASQTSGRRLTDSVAMVALIADGLEAAHANGLVHLDLKPANILIDREGRPHVTDFSYPPAHGMIMGTPSYVAPEIMLGQPVDKRADVYSLGVILYELLTGRRPFKGSTMELMHAILTSRPPPPRELAPHISEDLQCVCLTALDADRSLRQQSAAEFAAALRATPEGRV